MALQFCGDTQPGMNIWQSRWPALPLVLCALWRITGVTPLALYLLGAFLFILAATLACLTAYRRSEFPVTAAALAILLFQPLISTAAHGGTTEPLFALLSVLLLLLGYKLGEKPYRWMLPAALAVSLLVLCKPEGRFVAMFALLLFGIHYYRNGLFSPRLMIALLFCAVAGALCLAGFQLYVARNNLIPMDYRIGGYYFYTEYLAGKVAFNDENRYYTLMTFLDWLRLHSPGELLRILLRGLGQSREVFDRILFPGASVLTALGLLRAGFGGWSMPALFTLPFAVFYLAAYAFHSEVRFLLPFFCLGLLPALAGMKMIMNDLSRKLRLLQRVPADALPLIFGVVALSLGLIFPAEVQVGNNKDYADQSASQAYIGSLLKLGRFAEAEDSLEQGLRRNPDWAVFHLERAVTRYAGGQTEPALESLERAIALNPYLVEAYYAAYYLLSREGQPDRGVSYLERSLQYRPEFPPVRQLLLNIDASAGRRRNIDELCGRQMFGYYLSHEELAQRALAPIIAWSSLLQTHFPLEDKKPAPSGRETG